MKNLDNEEVWTVFNLFYLSSNNSARAISKVSGIPLGRVSFIINSRITPNNEVILTSKMNTL